jgi:hypothetical protein
MSSIDHTIKTLDNLHINYSLNEIGEVRGLGLNDDFNDTDTYKLRQLEYSIPTGKIIIREQMIREYDCDFDDTIISTEYKDSIPNNIPIEVYNHDDDFDCAENCTCKINK